MSGDVAPLLGGSATRGVGYGEAIAGTGKPFVAVTGMHVPTGPAILADLRDDRLYHKRVPARPPGASGMGADDGEDFI